MEFTQIPIYQPIILSHLTEEIAAALNKTQTESKNLLLDNTKRWFFI
jgi:hypothetical protein